MISAIEDWLRAPFNYSKGVELFNTHGKSDLLKKLFTTESSFTRDKLKEELIKINSVVVERRSPPPKEKIPPVNEFLATSESKFIHIDVNALPDDLKEKNRQKNALFMHSKSCFQDLKSAKTIEQRFQLAKTIVENFKEQDEIWLELEQFQATGSRKKGEVDKIEDLSQLNALELAKRLENIKKQYSKVSKLPEKKIKADELLAKWKEVEHALEKR